jgi:DNA-binding transcriptional MerR regulator
MTNSSYTPDEFAALVGSSNRNIRYLVTEGLIPRGRGTPPRVSYGDEHLAAYREYQNLAALGLSVRQIQDLARLGPEELHRIFTSIRSLASNMTTEQKETV